MKDMCKKGNICAAIHEELASIHENGGGGCK
jgi:hypothetical protein